MQKTKLSKKLFSAILSISIILGAVLAVPVSAEDVTYTTAKLSDGEVAQIAADNYLAADGIALTLKPGWGENTTYGCYVGYAWDITDAATRLTDGNTVNDDFGDGQTVSVFYRPAGNAVGLQLNAVTGTTVPTTDFFIRLMVDMKESKTFSDILLGWSDKGQVKSYNIYASESAATLYDSALVSVSSESDSKLNRLITLSEPVTARYISFEFKNTNSELISNVLHYKTDKKGINGVVLTELGVYEKVSEELKGDFEKSTLTDEEVAAGVAYNLLRFANCGNNTSLQYGPVKNWSINQDKATGNNAFTFGTLDSGNLQIEQFKRMTDGNTVNSDYRSSQYSPSAAALLISSTTNATSDSAVRLKFDMGASKTVSSFLVSWNEWAPVKGFKIYVSTATQWDYNTNKILVANVSENGSVAESCNRLVTLGEPVTARTVVFEFTLADFSENVVNKYNQEVSYDYAILLTQLAAYSNVTPKSVDMHSVNSGYGTDSVFTDVEATDNKYYINASENNVKALRIQSTSDEEYTIYISTNNTFAKAYATFSLTGSKLFTCPELLTADYIIITGAAAEKVGYSSSFSITPGDLTGNDLIQADDLVLVRKELLGNEDFSLKIKDANGDGSFNIIDLVNLKKKV